MIKHHNTESVNGDDDDNDNNELENSIKELLKEKYEIGRYNTEMIWKIIAGLAGFATFAAISMNVVVAFSDMRSAIRDVQGQISVLQGRQNDIMNKVSSLDVHDSDLDKKITTVDNNGSRVSIANEASIKDLQLKFSDLNSMLNALNQQLIQHNENMYKLQGKVPPPHSH